MPRKTIRDTLALPRGYRSREVASFIAQLDDLTRRLEADVRGLSVRQLEWQPGPGRNTIGMLLAHLAVVEVWWLSGPARDRSDVDFRKAIGIDADDDGMPAPPRGRHPRALRGRGAAWYLRTLRRARATVRRIARSMTPAQLVKVRSRHWRSQNAVHRYNNRWVLYHVLEHFGGHYGQILLLKELMKAPKRRAPGRKARS